MSAYPPGGSRKVNEKNKEKTKRKISKKRLANRKNTRYGRIVVSYTFVNREPKIGGTVLRRETREHTQFV